MICLERHESQKALQDRPRIARRRAHAAREILTHCRLCSHVCGVNRLSGERGLCNAGAQARCFSAQIESADELQLVPTFAIALNGCNLRCAFCISAPLSWKANSGMLFKPRPMAAAARRALAEGARTVMLLGGEPTVHLPSVLQFVAEMPAGTKLVLKTNAFCSAEARELLDGMIDIWVADFKFGNDTCARHLAQVPDYVRSVQQNLRWIHERRHLIVRHLLLPGHVNCCWRPLAEWLARELPKVQVSLRSEFWPAGRSAGPLELRRLLLASEGAQARSIAREFGLCLVE